MADRVATSLTRASSKVNANTNVSAEELAAKAGEHVGRRCEQHGRAPTPVPPVSWGGLLRPDR